MNLQELKIYAMNIAKENPSLKNEIFSLVELAMDEIADGQSEIMECNRAIADIEELLTEEN